MNKLLDNPRERALAVNWPLLALLLLLLNVKLVVKGVALLCLIAWQYRHIRWKEIFYQKQLRFYVIVIAIGLINFLILPKTGMSQALASAFGLALWFASLLSAFFLYSIVQKERLEKLFQTLSVFFILHFLAILFNLAAIMIECGTINPYTFKGFHQKYYISTGDHISGITMDSPVTTALVSAFGVIFFLYRKQFLAALLSMLGMVLIGSNVTNLVLVVALLFLFVSRSVRIQKSVIVLLVLVLVIFVGKISPQNNEYTGRFAYRILGLTYDKPKKNITPDFIRKQPDSSLSSADRKKKLALVYIDSISATRLQQNPDRNNDGISTGSNLPDKSVLKREKERSPADTFSESPDVKARVNRYHHFITSTYSAKEVETMNKLIPEGVPGKWIAVMQTWDYFRQHPGKLILGNGTANFSSRTAFKVSALGIAGSYPEKFRYIHPAFRNNHLYLYLYYHSQDQPKHAAENTPDSTYGQLLGEYGIAGIAVFLFFYLGYYLRSWKKLSFGAGILIILSGAFFMEYWFEQLSIVVLAELLLFIDIKWGNEKEKGA